MQNEPVIHRLPNGIRLATVAMPHMASVSVGFWVDVGSRHEGSNEHGMAHFVEHLLFKGTPTRNSREISRQIERIGGTIDGFTVEDHTCYHAKAPADQFATLFDVMADFYLHPVFDPREIESERRVIREEIAMVRDQPSQYLEDLLSEAAWGENHPLGRSITGTVESLGEFDRAGIFHFFKRAYAGRNTVIAVAGNIDHEQVVEIVTEKMGDLLPGASLPCEAAPESPTYNHRFGEYPSREQAQIALGFRAASRHQPERYPQKILNVLLGENMSSRLFQKIREDMGLCYEVQSDMVAFSDAGLLQVYLALDPDNLRDALRALDQIFDDFCATPISDSDLEEAKCYINGQSRIGLENTASQMMWAGESLLSFDKWVEPETVLERLNAVSPVDLQRAACQVFRSGNIVSAVVGDPVANSTLQTWSSGFAGKS